MPEIIIVAGPNGAGKTTFANDLLPLERERFVYLNADEIARELAGQDLTPTQRDIRAAREMLQHLDASIAAQHDIMFETTLATKTYVLKVPAWQRNGYQVKLFYLKLPSIEQSLARVARRVALGGHDIPAANSAEIRQKSI
jgi:predicted ABC-type ATPase